MNKFAPQAGPSKTSADEIDNGNYQEITTKNAKGKNIYDGS